MNGNKTRPSDERRAKLREADGDHFPTTLSNLRAIESYYGIADKVLSAFEDCYTIQQLDDAYIYGRRFAKFSMEALPTHDYYKSPKAQHINLRKKNIDDIESVLKKLEDVALQMDKEEIHKQKVRQQEEARRQEEYKQRLREQANQRKEDVELSAMQKLEMLRAPTKKPSFNKQSSSSSELGPPPPLPPSPLELEQEQYLPPPILPPASPSLPYDEYNDSTTTDDVEFPSSSSLSSLPSATPSATPSAPPSAPPAYSDVVDSSQYVTPATKKTKPVLSLSMNDTGDSALPTLYNLSFGSNKPSQPASVSNFVPSTPEVQKPITQKKPIIVQQPIRKLQILYLNKFDTFQKSKKIEIFPLSTYQGRLASTPGRDSTNGCTVISPLVAAHHLESQGSGIADSTIENIIDSKAPPILSAVRSKLGLRGDALIVPSDVHDYLVDRKILQQERFVGVCGGNILDDVHLGEFLNMLQSGKCIVTNNSDNGDGPVIPTTTRKVAAALFFHEHVVSILKLTVSNNNSQQQQSWYDIVDSMPARHLFNGRGCSSRTRCKDRQSLEVFLKKYAVSKFSESNCAYIDRNRWDDAMCDFDPRVFQAFVWAK